MSKNNIEFIEENHIYLLDGIVIPSVSEILSDGTYDNIPAHILEYAAERGRAVHLAAEMIDKGRKHNLELEFQPWLIQYLLFTLANQPYHGIKGVEKFEWDGIEEIVYTEEYAGTIDRFVTFHGKILIADIKTTSKLHTERIALQLGGYAKALAAMDNQKS